MIWIVDISNHQGSFDVAAAVAEGYSAVICKASEGTSYRDTRFDSFAAQTQAAGAIPGAYHYLRAGDGAAQARLLHSRITDHGGTDGWLCVLDNEADATWDTTVAFVEEWNRITNHHPLIMYSGGWWWKPRGWNGASLTPYLWDSHYTSGSGVGSVLYEQVPDSWWTPGYGGWARSTMLQFSSSARVSGQNVDVSAFPESLDDLLALARPAHVPGGSMGTIDGADPYQPDLPQAAELRNGYYAMMAGYQDSNATPDGVIGRLTRIEEAAANQRAALTDEQLAEVSAQIAAAIRGDLDTAVESALRRVFGGLGNAT
jgi:hypothetical protein